MALLGTTIKQVTDNPVKIKLCGMTQLEDATYAVELGAWAVGMVFHDESPRCCPLPAAVAISAQLQRQCEIVGVFHNASLGKIARIADDAALTTVQLHGDEGPAYCEEVARRTGCKVIKAIRVRSAADVLALRVYRSDYHLLDAHVPGTPGGTGESFPWDLARVHTGSVPVILAGGLNPLNVAEAIREAAPFAVDVASGIESAPGVKDHQLMAAFVGAVRGPQVDELVGEVSDAIVEDDADQFGQEEAA